MTQLPPAPPARPRPTTPGSRADEIAKIFAVLPTHRIAVLIAARREQAGTSRFEAARAAGITLSQLKDIESGAEAPKPVVLSALLACYGVSPEKFVPPRRKLNTGALGAGSAEQLLKSYVDAVRTWRGASGDEAMAFRHDDIRPLVDLLGTDPEEIERRLMKYTGCSREEAGLVRRAFLRRLAAVAAGSAAVGLVGSMSFSPTAAAAATTSTSGAPGAASPKAAPKPGNASAVPAAPASASTLIGVLQASTLRAATSYAAGVRSVVVAAHWSQFTPTKGATDQSYVTYLRGVIQKFRGAGMKIVLSPGLANPPAWAFGLSATTRFVDQYGTVWKGGDGADVPDAVFDPAVRQAQFDYLLALGAALKGTGIDAVRAGGLCYGELRYPSAGYHNSYWAYSAAAQAQSPVRGWRPGQSGTSKATTFLAWYLGAITDYQNALVAATMRAFASTRVMVMYPGWGIRPGQAALAAAGGLNGKSPAEVNGALQQGQDFASQVAALPAGATVYTTNLASPNQSAGAAGQAPIYFLQTLAAKRGLPLAGENAGEQSEANLARCVDRAHALRLTDLLWMTEDDLYNPGPAGPSLAQFSQEVQQLAASG